MRITRHGDPLSPPSISAVGCPVLAEDEVVGAKGRGLEPLPLSDVVETREEEREDSRAVRRDALGALTL